MACRFKSVLSFFTIAVAILSVSSKHVSGTSQKASDILPNGYVSGAAPAELGQFPWMAFIRYENYDAVEEEATSSYCGGSLISDRYVLSAAHCFEDVNEIDSIEIYLGGNNFCEEGGWGCLDSVMIKPDMVWLASNDIALFRLHSRAPLSATIQPIALPPFDPDKDIFDGAPVYVAGWGETESTTESNKLLSTKVNLIVKHRCLEMKLAFEVPETHLCAGTPNGKDTCPGDSGGPLMMYYKNKYYLAGITSEGLSLNDKCGMSKAGYYVNVYKYKEIIQDTIRTSSNENSWRYMLSSAGFSRLH